MREAITEDECRSDVTSGKSVVSFGLGEYFCLYRCFSL